jgi:hypothetical protein
VNAHGAPTSSAHNERGQAVWKVAYLVSADSIRTKSPLQYLEVCDAVNGADGVQKAQEIKPNRQDFDFPMRPVADRVSPRELIVGRACNVLNRRRSFPCQIMALTFLEGILPIPSQTHTGLTTYDAKDPNTKFPPIEPLRPPKGAPNGHPGANSFS